jgi:uncharacterized membrane-anchored protein YjiN (DUF445 family)
MNDTEATLAARLRRMQRLATGLVVLMAALFVATSLLRERVPGLDLVWAFAEAALIGGLADWFAVTALFRHPLGLPIPHTAIVPNRKDEIGQALARFVGEHFLVRDAIERRLERVDLGERLGLWLGQAHNAELLARDLAVAFDWLLRGTETGHVRGALKDGLQKVIEGIPPTSVIAVLVDVLASGNHARGLIDQLVQFGRDQLEKNKGDIRERIRDRSPWWLPGFVDEKIYDQLVGELERILGDIGDDPAHPARAHFNERLKSIKYALGHDEQIITKGQLLRTELTEHPAVRDFVRDTWGRVRDYLLEAMADPDSDIRRNLALELRAIGGTVARDPAVRAQLDRRLRELVVYVVENYRAQITEIISETVALWDAASTARRIELHIGRDLQFIRINGTLVGGLVGVVLYLAWQLVTAQFPPAP